MVETDKCKVLKPVGQLFEIQVNNIGNLKNIVSGLQPNFDIIVTSKCEK